MRAVIAILAVLGLLAIGAVEVLGTSDKVTICHAAGLDGTTHYETLTIAYEAVYGEAGHFYENGTPRAGHEQDYLGACQSASPLPSPSSSPSPSPSPSPSEEPAPPQPLDIPPPQTDTVASSSSTLDALAWLVAGIGIGLVGYALVDEALTRRRRQG